MKHLFILLLVLFLFKYGYTQIQLNDQLKIVSNDKLKSISDFVAYHKLDYALVLWHTSNWVNSYEVYDCLFRKEDKWSLVQIKNDANQAKGFPYKLFIKQKILNIKQADSLLKVFELDSTFCYKQVDFDKLPESCEYKKDGKLRGLNSIMDAGTSHLVQFKGDNIEVLTFYAADRYFAYCYPYVPKFGILKGYVNTISHLGQTSWNLFEKK